MPMSARMVYQDIPVLGNSPTTNLTEEGRKMLIHALTAQAAALDLDFLNSPLQTLADVAAYGQDAYRHSSASDEKENDPVGVPITAPVPLSYAVRGKSALRSILSMGEEEEGGILWDDSATVQCRDSQQIYAPISNARFEEHTPAFQPVYGSEVHANNHVSGNSGYPARPPMIIRPITPSTLMALTEPCLMAWCSKSALDQRFPPVNVSVDGTEAINYMPPSGHSSWGY